MTQHLKCTTYIDNCTAVNSNTGIGIHLVNVNSPKILH